MENAVEELASDAPTIRLADIAGSYRRRRSGTIVPLRSRVLLDIPGQDMMRGHTLDIAEDRLTVSVPSVLNNGQECAVFLALTVAEQTFAIVGTAEVKHCEHSGDGHYIIDLSFAVSNKKSRIAIEQLFGSKRRNRIQ
jgi:hypothetical protein